MNHKLFAHQSTTPAEQKGSELPVNHQTVVAPVKHPPVQASSTESETGALSPGQKHIFEKVMKGQSVFITGSAGTGKSFLLRKIIHQLKQVYKSNFEECVAITASTGPESMTPKFSAY
jgi:phosphate starvation-inducible protein PhoH